MNFIWKNGKFHEGNQALSIRDRALRGDGVFDAMLCIDGTPIQINAHTQRLIDHAKTLGIQTPSSAPDLTGHIHETIAKNGATSGHHCINTTITRGEAQRGLKTPTQSAPTIIIHITPLPSNAEPAPINAITANTTRRNEFSPLSQIKSLNYGDNILSMIQAETSGANEAIMLNTQGNATCFTSGNLFALIDNQLTTPPLTDGVMNGIIRQKWIETSNAVERSLAPDNLQNAQAIFLTNSIRGIMPIQTLNGKTLPKTNFSFDPHIHLR